MAVSKVYFPQDRQITIHQSRFKHYPAAFPAGFYWYGSNQKGLGKIPEWVQSLLSNGDNSPDSSQSDKEGETTDVLPPGDTVTSRKTDIHTKNDPMNDEVEALSDIGELDHITQTEATKRPVADRSPNGPYHLRRQSPPSRKRMEAQARD